MSGSQAGHEAVAGREEGRNLLGGGALYFWLPLTAGVKGGRASKYFHVGLCDLWLALPSVVKYIIFNEFAFTKKLQQLS